MNHQSTSKQRTTPTTTLQNIQRMMCCTIAHRTFEVEIATIVIVGDVLVVLVVDEQGTLVVSEVDTTTVVEVLTILVEVVTDKVLEAEEHAMFAANLNIERGNAQTGMTKKTTKMITMERKKLSSWILRYDYMISLNHPFLFVTTMKKKKTIKMIKIKIIQN